MEQMLKPLFEIWENFSKRHVNINSNELAIEEIKMQVKDRMENMFLLGPSYFFIFNNLETKFEFVSENILEILGYSNQDCNLTFLLSKIHPEDLPWFTSIQKTHLDFYSTIPVSDYFKYKISYDYRIMNAAGNYERLLEQIIQVDVTANYVLGFDTIISHLKMNGKPTLSYIGLDGNPSYLNVDVKNIFGNPKTAFSAREREVLSKLISGNTTKEIADNLNISTHTVEAHRKNMLKKSNCDNTAEMLSKSILEGWV